MQYIAPGAIPDFVPRSDLTAEELTEMKNNLITAINELAGRIYIMKDRITKGDRNKYSEISNFPILDEMDRLARELVRAFNDIDTNHTYAKSNINMLFNKCTNLERRLNSLDDRVALKTDLNALIERVNYVRDHSLPSVGPDNNWYIGDINTGVAATGNSGVYMGNTEPTDPAVGVWIDTSDETTIAVAEEVKF